MTVASLKTLLRKNSMGKNPMVLVRISTLRNYVLKNTLKEIVKSRNVVLKNFVGNYSINKVDVVGPIV